MNKNASNEFLARLLKRAAPAYAGYASNELWREWLVVRVQELAAAVAVEQPRLFASQVLWAKAALEARGASTEKFRAVLASLRNVLQRELPQEVRYLATQYVDEALDSFDEQTDEVAPRLLPNTPHGQLASTYLLALLEGDRRRASRLILDASHHSMDIQDLYMHVLLAAQRELGVMWLTGEINVAEEHFASHTTKMVMAKLLANTKFETPNGKTVLAAAVAGNQHDIGLYAVADFFEMAGWRVIQLGADVPIHTLVQALECFNVDLLALSASLFVQLETFKSTIQTVRDNRKSESIKVIAGGHAFAGSGDLSIKMGADAYAENPAEAVQFSSRLT